MSGDNVVTGVWFGIIGVALIAGLVSASPALRGEQPGPPPEVRPAVGRQVSPVGEESRMDKATFGAGCFWGVEEVFRKLEGVTDTEVGYMGGTAAEPAYRQVCSGGTGHAEVCEVTFDAAKISYAELLETFWAIHDPTQVNRQGPDVGDQYRSVIFCHGAEQRSAAERSKAELEKSGRHRGPVATAIEPAGEFWPAEEYHQRYFEKKGGGACHLPGK